MTSRTRIALWLLGAALALGALAAPARAGRKDVFIYEADPKFALVKSKKWDFVDLAEVRKEAYADLEKYEKQIAEQEKQLAEFEQKLPELEKQYAELEKQIAEAEGNPGADQQQLAAAKQQLMQFKQARQQLPMAKKQIAQQKQQLMQEKQARMAYYQALQCKVKREDPGAEALVFVLPYDKQRQGTIDDVMKQTVSQVEKSAGAKIVNQQRLTGKKDGFVVIFTHTPEGKPEQMAFQYGFFKGDKMIQLVINVGAEDFKNRKYKRVKKEILVLPEQLRFL